MKKLFVAFIASVSILSIATNTFAAPTAIILDNSYSPQNARPIVSVFEDNYANAEVTINDDSYTPVHEGPQRPIFDGIDPRAVYNKCPGCGQSTWRSVSKAFYEYNPVCGHPVYFKGKACTRETACGQIQVDKWIYSCSCWG